MSTSSPPFAPIRPNPYIVGNPVRDATMFFGRDAEFEFVQRRFHGSERGGLIVFCGDRRSGKTSILFQILDGRLGADFCPVLLDMQSMAVRSEAEFLSRIAAEVVQALPPDCVKVTLPEFGGDRKPSSVFLDFMKSWLDANPSKKPVMLIDEYELIENKIEAGILSTDLLHMFSHLMERYSIFMVFTGSQHIEKRQAQYWRILSQSVFRAVSYLQREDALRLIREPVAGRVRYLQGTDDTIYRLTAGQPFYTQAVCQNLVDHLNEAETSDATPELLARVVQDIVHNAFPQMVFLWEGLETGEKLTLALLAEALAGESAACDAAELMQLLRKRSYPLVGHLDSSKMATALESLFAKELLSKSSDKPPRYAFRMDLWRQWIHIMHSVYQVMRELGISSRDARSWRRRSRLVAVAALGVITLLAVTSSRWRERLFSFNVHIDQAAVPDDLVGVQVRIPAYSRLAVDGQPPRATGAGYKGDLPVGREMIFRVTAPGYADSIVRLTPHPRQDASDSAIVVSIDSLRAIFGSVRVETRPSGATVTVAGRPAGRSPVNLLLQVRAPTDVTATLAGYGVARTQVSAEWNDTTHVMLALTRSVAQLVVVTNPPEARLAIDGKPQATGQPLALDVGQHRFTVTRSGYVELDSTHVVVEATRSLVFELERQAPGELELQGRMEDYFREVYVDGERKYVTGRANYTVQIAPGDWPIRIELTSGAVIETTVRVRAGMRTVYDCARRQVEFVPLGGS